MIFKARSVLHLNNILLLPLKRTLFIRKCERIFQYKFSPCLPGENQLQSPVSAAGYLIGFVATLQRKPNRGPQ